MTGNQYPSDTSLVRLPNAPLMSVVNWSYTSGRVCRDSSSNRADFSMVRAEVCSGST